MFKLLIWSDRKVFKLQLDCHRKKGSKQTIGNTEFLFRLAVLVGSVRIYDNIADVTEQLQNISSISKVIKLADSYAVCISCSPVFLRPPPPPPSLPPPPPSSDPAA